MRKINNRFEIIYQQKKLHSENGWQTKKRDIEIINWVKRLLNLVNIPSGKLLELGCGAGNISVALLELGYELTGIDISSTAIEWAKQKFKQQNYFGDFQVGNATDLSQFEANSFDIILDSLCFHSLIQTDRKKALLAINRILKNEGFFLLMTMCGVPRNKTLKQHFDPISNYLFFDNVPECYLGPPKDLLKELTENQFTIVHHYTEIGNTVTGDQDMFFAICQKNI